MWIYNLVGKTLVEVNNNGDESIEFICSDGSIYLMYHRQDCCESVYIEEIHGDLQELLNSPVLFAEESSNSESDNDGSVTWTFYKISTVKHSVTIRWYGTSNGYYSESVDFEQIK